MSSSTRDLSALDDIYDLHDDDLDDLDSDGLARPTATEVPPGRRPTARRAWTPEAGSETAALLRRLALTPWLVGGRDDDLIAAVRRNETALRHALGRLGWVLIVESDLVRLRKGPPVRPLVWAEDGPSPLTCSWFFLLVAAAESVPPRCGLSQLVTGARAAAAEADIAVTNDLTERRAVVAALKLLAERGVVEPLDGNVDGYVRDEHAPVLLAVHHTRLVHVIANPGTHDPAADPDGWLSGVRREPDPARRMRRRLVDDTVVHGVELDEAEADWLRRRVRSDDGANVAAAFGLHLERRTEGAAFVVPDDAYRHARELGPHPFPVSGTVSHAAVLLCDHAAAHSRTDGGPGPGWRGVSSDDIDTVLTKAAAAQSSGRGGWSRDLADDPALLATKAADLLTGLNLLRLHETAPSSEHTGAAQTTWWFAPTTGRWAPLPPPAATPTVERAPVEVAVDPELDLLSLVDGEAGT